MQTAGVSPTLSHVSNEKEKGNRGSEIRAFTPAGGVVSRSERVFLSGRLWWKASVAASRERGCWGKGSPAEGDGDGDGDGECWRRSTPWNFPPLPSPAGDEEQQRSQSESLYPTQIKRANPTGLADRAAKN